MCSQPECQKHRFSDPRAKKATMTLLMCIIFAYSWGGGADGMPSYLEDDNIHKYVAHIITLYYEVELQSGFIEHHRLF